MAENRRAIAARWRRNHCALTRGKSTIAGPQAAVLSSIPNRGDRWAVAISQHARRVGINPVALVAAAHIAFSPQRDALSMSLAAVGVGARGSAWRSPYHDGGVRRGHRRRRLGPQSRSSQCEIACQMRVSPYANGCSTGVSIRLHTEMCLLECEHDSERFAR